MEWDALGAIGEILGAVAVFGSLMYLAIQIKAQNKESRLTAVHAAAETMRGIYELFVTDGEIAEIFNKVSIEGIDGVGGKEATRFVMLMHIACKFWEESYYQHQEGRLDARIWSSVENQFSAMKLSKGFNQFWESRGSYYSDDFKRYLAGLTPTGAFSTVPEAFDLARS